MWGWYSFRQLDLIMTFCEPTIRVKYVFRCKKLCKQSCGPIPGSCFRTSCSVIFYSHLVAQATCYIYVARYDSGSSRLMGLFLRNVTRYFWLIFKSSGVIKLNWNKPMLVDEYHDTSWTRGQYPAAPPDRLD